MPETTTEIPRAGWNAFFSKFSRDHEPDLVALEVMGSDIGAQIEGRTLHLAGIAPANEAGDSVSIMFDAIDGAHLTHMVTNPTHVWLQRSVGNADEALEIESADGTKTLVRFGAHGTTRQADEFIGSEHFPRKGDDEL